MDDGIRTKSTANRYGTDCVFVLVQLVAFPVRRGREGMRENGVERTSFGSEKALHVISVGAVHPELRYSTVSPVQDLAYGFRMKSS